MDSYTTFGPWVKYRRRERSITQDDLSQQVGCAISTIRKIENGILRPSRDMAQRIARFLEIDQALQPEFIKLARSPISSDLTAASAAPGLAALPVPQGRLIGREAEVALVFECVLQRQARLITLVGPPGVGKTRLALAIAAEMSAPFAGNVAFIPLEAVSDASMVLPTIAEALHVTEQTGKTLLVAIQAAVASRRLLLVLDNLEHVLAASAEIAALLGACPQLTILTTSQEVLHVSYEQQVPVLPLPTPPRDSRTDWQTLEGYAAVALFVAHARQILPAFALTPENAPAVAAICARLDGIPMAIQLIAARVKVMAPPELLERLDTLTALVLDHQQTRAPRQHTLRSAIGWSYQYLSEAEQQLFRVLGVCVGGCTLDALETIANLDATSTYDVTEQLSTLLDKSMIQCEHREGSEPRFTMLTMLREYAQEQLEISGEREAVYACAARYFIGLAQAALPAKRGEHQIFWIERLETEYHNIRAALQWSSANEPALFEQLTVTLGWFWRIHCRLSEATFWIEQALNGVSIASPLQSRLLYEAGMLALFQNALPQARIYLEHSLLIDQAAGSHIGVAETLNELATVYCNMDDLAGARMAYERCIAVWKDLDRPWEQAVATANLGYIHLMTEQHDLAMAAFRAAQALLPAQSDYVLEGNILTNIGWTAYVQADPATARDYFVQALTIHQRLKSRLFLPEQLEGLAGCAGRLGKPERGALWLGAAARIRERILAPIPPIDRPRYDLIVESIERALAPALFMERWSQGQRSTAEEIIALVLEDAHPGEPASLAMVT